jgi:hypothetical protein
MSRFRAGDKVFVTPSAKGHQMHDGEVVEVVIEDRLYRVRALHGIRAIYLRTDSELAPPLTGH